MWQEAQPGSTGYRTDGSKNKDIDAGPVTVFKECPCNQGKYRKNYGQRIHKAVGAAFKWDDPRAVEHQKQPGLENPQREQASVKTVAQAHKRVPEAPSPSSLLWAYGAHSPAWPSSAFLPMPDGGAGKGVFCLQTLFVAGL